MLFNEVMKRQLLTGLKFLALMAIITGIIYPLLITGFAELFFRKKAEGSLIERNGIITGSKLIGQNFDSVKYFWSRPSAINYNPLPSGGSNLGPLNPALIDGFNKRRESFISANNLRDNENIPSEMICSSASGLDPHISPAAALLQVNRVAKARGLDKNGEDRLISLVNRLSEKRQFSLLGEPRINVFLLNLQLDSLK